MNKILIPSLISLTVMALLVGCALPGSVNTTYGGPTTVEQQNTTMGQQLIDLQKAKDSGAITDAEYQAGKAKILNGRTVEKAE